MEILIPGNTLKGRKMINREYFIKKYLEILKEELKLNLPEQGTLDELFDKSFRIIREYEKGVRL
jgi:hypothetical protein